ncbi:hypothetical protein RUM44_009123 [Polyplax serrata]|uniref:SH2 domain-containing protein n=1 Tax=Polyplax serrata TaxID=468196 RepID=A0ABR1ART3_POLSC
MSERKKFVGNKPPVPARPKNLVIFNSKHLPKPPETFSTESVTNFIKDLNLDVKDEGSDLQTNKTNQTSLDKYDNSGNSDGEEDAYGYLEPVTLSATNPPDMAMNAKNLNRLLSHKKSLQAREDNVKMGDIFQKIMIRNKSMSNVAKSIVGNLGGRLANEMADFGFNMKRRLMKTSKIRLETDKEYLGRLSETSDLDEGKVSQISQNQWQRPLPLPPTETRSEVTCMPWYKSIDRRKGEEILRNGIDGYFLVRPSSNIDTYLTLTLWYSNRVYNIPIRKRKDGKFALGTPKANEQCFDSVEMMVKNYQSEKLVLYSNGVQTGKTLLTTYPP